jgi:hypothetical protein
MKELSKQEIESASVEEFSHCVGHYGLEATIPIAELILKKAKAAMEARSIDIKIKKSTQKEAVLCK